MEPAEFARLVRKIQKINPITSVRLTGGEPTIYRPIVELVRLLKLDGMPIINLTTNASRLKELASDLKEAGLDSINISLDSLNRENFRAITRRDDLERVLAGIDAALAVGFPVKINCTIYRGINEKEIVEMLQYAGERGMVLRFLELMSMGHLYQAGHTSFYYSQEEMLQRVGESYDLEPLPRKASSTANYWKTSNGWKFGIIGNHSAPFCKDCNRLRLDSKGKLYGCLSVNEGFSMLDVESDEELEKLLKSALKQKQPVRFSGSTLSMKAIGG